MEEGLDPIRAYRLSEVSRLTSVPVSTLKRWAREGRVRAKKAGKLWRMTGRDIQYFLDHGTMEQEVTQQEPGADEAQEVTAQE